MEFTGEVWIPGKTPKRIELDHLARYRFACQFVKGKTVLDIACGTGYGAKLLKQAGARFVEGVDASIDCVQFAFQYGEPNLYYQVGDIETFYRVVGYNVVVCFETIEHVEDYRAAINNLYRLTSLGGTLIISTPLKSYPGQPANPYHVHEFEVDELATELETAGFTVTERLGQRQKKQPGIGPIVDTPKYFILVAEK
jgi:SAM-dependent methyltransferase